MATRNLAATYPLIALCCAGVTLFTIGAAIVLALIPLYLPQKTATLASINALQKQLTYQLDVPSTVALGDLSDSERAQLTKKLQSSQTPSTQNSGTVAVTSAKVTDGSNVSGGRKRRQGSTDILIMIILVTGRTNAILILIENRLSSYIQLNSASIGELVVLIIDSRTTTTTISPNILSTTTVPPGIVSTTTIPPGIVSTTTISSGMVSTTTVPSGIVSTIIVGRRRRRRHEVYEGSSTLPLVTYKD